MEPPEEPPASLCRRGHRHLADGVRRDLGGGRGGAGRCAGRAVAGRGCLGLGRVLGHLPDRSGVRSAPQPGGQPGFRHLSSSRFPLSIPVPLLDLADAGGRAGGLDGSDAVRLLHSPVRGAARAGAGRAGQPAFHHDVRRVFPQPRHDGGG